MRTPRLAAQALATAPADGYTVMMAAAATVVMNPLLNAKLGYDPARDFTAVGPRRGDAAGSGRAQRQLGAHARGPGGGGQGV